MTALRQRMLEDMQLRNLSEQTQKLYLSSVERLAKHYHKSPDAISDEELRQYFLYLRNEKKVAHSTATVELCVIRFLYRHSLQRELGTLELVRPKKSQKLPDVLSVDEDHQLLEHVHRPHHQVCLSTIYACGLRVSEGTQLQISEIDSAHAMLSLFVRPVMHERLAASTAALISFVSMLNHETQPALAAQFSDLATSIGYRWHAKTFDIALAYPLRVCLNSIDCSFSLHQQLRSIRIIQQLKIPSTSGLSVLSEPVCCAGLTFCRRIILSHSFTSYTDFHSVYFAASFTDRTNDLYPDEPGREGFFVFSHNDDWSGKSTQTAS